MPKPLILKHEGFNIVNIVSNVHLLNIIQIQFTFLFSVSLRSVMMLLPSHLCHMSSPLYLLLYDYPVYIR